MTNNRALWELVDSLRESANVDWSTATNKDWAEWVRDRANGSAAGKRYAADAIQAILECPVVVGDRPPREWTEAAYARFLRINDGDEDKAKTDLGTWAIGTHAALESMVRGKS